MIAEHDHYFTEQHKAAEEWANDLLASSGWVILDTETTGLGPLDQVIEVGILLPNGDPAADFRIRPTIVIPEDATRVHGITNAMLANLPDYSAVHGTLCEILNERRVVVFNAAYDSRLLTQTARVFGWKSPLENADCAMLQYSRWVGDWNDYRGDFKWQKLPPVPGEKAHSAIADCRATLRVIQSMAGIR